MEVEPARPIVFILRSVMDSLRLPGNIITPAKRTLPVIEYATSLNIFRIIIFD